MSPIHSHISSGVLSHLPLAVCRFQVCCHSLSCRIISGLIFCLPLPPSYRLVSLLPSTFLSSLPVSWLPRSYMTDTYLLRTDTYLPCVPTFHAFRNRRHPC